MNALAALLLAASLSSFAADAPKPKYGPAATMLSQSHAYLKSAAAPDYWALSPYYVPQRDGASCTLASITMVVNAARSGAPGPGKLTADDKLALQDEVLKRAGDEAWTNALSGKARTISVDKMGEVAKKSLEAYGLKVKSVEVIHVDKIDDATRAKVRAALEGNEKSAKDFIVANFLQSAYTGDSDTGHVSPVGAYDAKNRRVLVFDTDREWYEPYWVSEETFLKGMATFDKDSGRNRGLFRITLE